MQGRERFYNVVMAHELGHLFGLGDKYSGTSFKNSFIYSSGVSLPSIMDCDTNHITCDDVDGFIAAVRRVAEYDNYSFDSFCNNGVVITGGVSDNIQEGKTRTIKESYMEFNSEVRISYTDTTAQDQTYYMEIILTDFPQSTTGLNALTLMGFNADNELLNANSIVIVQAQVKERNTPRNAVNEVSRNLAANAFATLFINGEAVQIIAVKIPEENADNTGARIFRETVKTGNVEILEQATALPFVNYYPTRKPTPETNIWDNTYRRMKSITGVWKNFLLNPQSGVTNYD